MVTKQAFGAALCLVLSIPAMAASRGGHVFTISNEVAGNRLLVYDLAEDGSLTAATSVDTGGRGSGGGLGNEGALAVTGDGRWLLAVNPGSDNVSVFELTRSGPLLRDVAHSGGRNPISLDVAGRRVVVLNAGGAVGATDKIDLFELGPHGRLERIRGATRPLSAANVGPAQVSFALEGAVVVVTEKATNLIDTFVLDDDGAPSNGAPHPSAGATPFGFAVNQDDQLLVSEAGTNSLSSYQVNEDGDLETVTEMLPTHQLAPCWVAVTRNGRFGYTSDAHNGMLTGVAISRDGSLSLLEPDGATASTDGGGPLDLVVSRDRRFLVVLVHGANAISSFRIMRDGSLQPAGEVGGVPPASTGLVAR